MQTLALNCISYFKGPLTIGVKVSVVLFMGISRVFCEAQGCPVSYSDGVRNHADSLLNDFHNQDCTISNYSSFSFFFSPFISILLFSPIRFFSHNPKTSVLFLLRDGVGQSLFQWFLWFINDCAIGEKLLKEEKQSHKTCISKLRNTVIQRANSVK